MIVYNEYFFKKKPDRKWTYMVKLKSKLTIYWQVINILYIIISVLNKFSTDSNHRMIITKIIVRVKIK